MIENITDKYPFIKLCNYYRLMSKIHYFKFITLLKEYYNQVTGDCNDNDYLDRLKKSIESTEYLLSILSIKPNHLALTECASVQLEYEKGSLYLEIEVFSELIKFVVIDRDNYSLIKRIELSLFEVYKLENMIYEYLID